MKVGYIQNSPTFGDKENNFKEINKLVGKLKADLLVLPELFATGYLFTSKKELKELAETTKGETADFLKNLSQKTGAVVVAGFAEKSGDKFYNSAIIVYKNKVLGVYRKIHLFNDEKKWFTPGNKPFKVYNVKGMKIGVMVCFDWAFPEVARTLAIKGAQIIAHPSNLVLQYCQKAMTTRCIENGVFAVTANRIGTDKRGGNTLKFTGASQITGVKGEILSSASKNKASVDIVDIDIKKANNKMITKRNHLFKDRRVNYYI